MLFEMAFPFLLYSSVARPKIQPAWNTVLPQEGLGFPPDFVQLMWDNFRANLNVEGSGAVVAAPDR
jgi:hypothetical protein